MIYAFLSKKCCDSHLCTCLYGPNRSGLLESQALQYRIWNLGPSSKKLHKGKIWDFGTKLGLFWDHFYTLLGLLVVIFIKMPQNLQKGFKNRVVTTFNAKLTLFGDHFSVMFPVLYQPCTTNLEPPEPLMASYVRFMAF